MDTFAPRILTNGFCKLKMWRGEKKERKREISFLLTSIKFSIDIVYLHYMRIGQIGISFQF